MDVSFWDMVLRLGAATLLAGVLGIEREIRDRDAGLRTHVLVSLAAAVFALISLEITAEPFVNDDRLRIDPLRLVEAVTAGVAFLAAGLIIVKNRDVKGLTTGAGMWLAAAIGLACGLGYYVLSALATAFGFAALSVFRWLAMRAALREGGDDG
jgi:putative Mg2+ transporter-C (MgtC) family protein